MPSKRFLHEFKQVLYCVKNEEYESNHSLRMMMDSFQTQLADPQEQARIGITYLLMSIKPLRAKVDVAIVGDKMVFVDPVLKNTSLRVLPESTSIIWRGQEQRRKFDVRASAQDRHNLLWTLLDKWGREMTKREAFATSIERCKQSQRNRISKLKSRNAHKSMPFGVTSGNVAISTKNIEAKLQNLKF